MTRRNVALTLAGLGAAALGLYGVWGAPRVTLSNTGLGMDYPAPRALAILVAAISAFSLAFVLPRRVLGIAAVVAAAVFSVVGLHRLAYSLVVGPGGLYLRDLGGARRLAWRDVAKVEPESNTLGLQGRGEERLVIDTSGFTAEQRASLERTIARRVKEAQN